MTGKKKQKAFNFIFILIHLGHYYENHPPIWENGAYKHLDVTMYIQQRTHVLVLQGKATSLLEQNLENIAHKYAIILLG